MINGRAGIEDAAAGEAGNLQSSRCSHKNRNSDGNLTLTDKLQKI
jgi:hypothetical protein